MVGSTRARNSSFAPADVDQPHIDGSVPAVLRPKDRLGSNSRRGMKHDDAPGLEVLIDDQKACYGAEGIEQKLPDAAGAVQGDPGEEAEQDIVAEVPEDVIHDLPPGAAQSAAHIEGQSQIGQMGKRGLPDEFDDQRGKDREAQGAGGPAALAGRKA